MADGETKPGPKPRYGKPRTNFRLGPVIEDHLRFLADHYEKTKTQILRELIAERYEYVVYRVEEEKRKKKK